MIVSSTLQTNVMKCPSNRVLMNLIRGQTSGKDSSSTCQRQNSLLPQSGRPDLSCLGALPFKERDKFTTH
ncbi:hypothetical protein PC112_g22951 [Phytophthora cactorum]|nr:hypothetical protein PC112_g22951 [Phytophthora cactorum]KAG2980379.1 hypothetical protein PC120_g24978 [Phytophthora cactorum]KAG4038982.1 hypothetical protein PC123_g25463 [Phytophthora cactorum]